MSELALKVVMASLDGLLKSETITFPQYQAAV
jgi:hypothetical protein